MSLYALFNQDQVWVDANGNHHQIDEMSVRYKANVVGFIERRAKTLGMGYALDEIAAIFAPIGREVIGVDGGQEILGAVVYGGPRGEMACDALESAMAEDDHRREQDPIGWIRDTKLMRRLISDVEQGLGGVDD
jgi:hypothetical protein